MYMTAHTYKELYRNLNVPLVNENEEITGWRKVDVNKYLLVSNKNAGKTDAVTHKPLAEDYNIQHSTNALDALGSKIKAHFAKPGAKIKVFVSTAELDERVFNTAGELLYRSQKAFWGKGSPEEIQITLQLAVRFKLVTPENLQQYCDDKTDRLAQGRIGLDCNGFVGNYLVHGFRGNPWDSEKAKDTHLASTGIRDIMSTLGPEVKTIDDIGMLETYVMGLVGADGQVINGGASWGHIVVTTPFTRPVVNSFPSYVPSIIMRVVESTGDVGITESDYVIQSVQKGIFTVWRGSKSQTMKVRMRPVK